MSKFVDAARTVELDEERVGRLPLAAVEFDHCVGSDRAVVELAESLDRPVAAREPPWLLALLPGVAGGGSIVLSPSHDRNCRPDCPR